MRIMIDDELVTIKSSEHHTPKKKELKITIKKSTNANANIIETITSPVKIKEKNPERITPIPKTAEPVREPNLNANDSDDSNLWYNSSSSSSI
jgi:hypothetical protein